MQWGLPGSQYLAPFFKGCSCPFPEQRKQGAILSYFCTWLYLQAPRYPLVSFVPFH